jgi:hypothetical protein
MGCWGNSAPHKKEIIQMAYNQNDDKLIKEFKVDDINVTIGIYSYKGGEPKVQLTRVDAEKFLKLGRLSIREIEFIQSCIDEVVDIVKAKLE